MRSAIVAAPPPLWYKRSVPIVSPLLVVLLAAPEMGVLVIEGGAADTPVTIDGQAVGALPLPGPWTLPPGNHEVVVGGKKHTVKVTAGKEARLNVGAKGARAAALAEQPVVYVHKPGFSLATAGYVAGGLGVAALGLGVYFGLDADDLAQQANDLDRRNPSNSRDDQDKLSSDAERSAFTANLLYGVGGVLVAGGAVMFLLSSDGPLSVAATPGGLVVGGRF